MGGKFGTIESTTFVYWVVIIYLISLLLECKD